ncbi:MULTISPECIES: hypothetical protein [unclassified Clostridium]|uniref:hypothetical protein n=1 Tax=unclassified Clostridium TaxID=2614128 RepID=UPI0013FB0485|nr:MULTISPECIES: hypothetical protein [unclassified Clostridium]NFO56386.1 hypothetical protein [Clostridium botulinum]
MNYYYEEIDIGTYVNGDYTINTIKPKYSNEYETAVMLTEFGEWHIVEKDINKKDAEKSYNKYCNMTQEQLDKLI